MATFAIHIWDCWPSGTGKILWLICWFVTYLHRKKKNAASILAEFKLVLSHISRGKSRTVAIPQKYQGWFICGQRCLWKPRVLHMWPAKDSAGKAKRGYLPCSAALILSSPVLQVYVVWTKSLGEFPICLCVRVICGRHCTWSAALELEALDTIWWASVEREICLILSQVKESSGS